MPEHPPVDLVVIGNLLIDQLPPGRKEPGGAALYTALAAAKLGLKVGLHSVVGTDYPVELLECAGIQLSLSRLPGPGGRTVIEYGENGRTLTHVGPGHEVMTPQTPHPFVTKLVAIAPMPWSWQLFHLTRCQPGTGLLDPYPTLDLKRWSELKTSLDKLCYLILNAEEIELDTDLIPKQVPTLIKEGSRGGHCRKSQLRWEAAPVEVIDPTGAGDSFLAGFAAGLVREWPLEACLDQGSSIAAKVIQAQGARALL